MADSPPITTLDFLHALHGDVGPGFIETRVLSDGERIPAIDRRWFATPEELINSLPRLMKLGETHTAGVFVGVLRRRNIGLGTNEDALPGRVVWADLDYKDYAGGEAEARGRLAKFTAKPSIIVRSAHGLHAYWLLLEPLAPAQISEICKAIADVLGGDTVHDAARILRLPGTFNRKDATNPVLVEIETFAPELRHDAHELRAVLARAKPTASRSHKAHPGQVPPQSHGAHVGMSERVLTLLRSNKKVSSLYFGIGKPKAGKKGQPLDTSLSGYDFSFVAALVDEGVLDPGELVAALISRPDGHARGKGQNYADRTVKAVLEKYAPRELNPYDELQITKVVIFDSNPPVYEITVLERTFRVTAEAFATTRKFRVEYLSATHKIPRLPGQDDWPVWANQLLERAERREMPPEASTEPALREAVQAAIDDMPITDDSSEIATGKAWDLGDGVKGFMESAVRNRIKDDFPGLGRHDVSRVLNALGYVSASDHRVGGKPRRLWSRVTAT